MSLLKRFIPYVLLLLLAAQLRAASTADLEDRTREIATDLRCVVCQNLSVADSPSEMAQQMRAVVREQLQAGKTPEQIKDFFVSKYGEWVLLKPRTTGVSAILWILPYVFLVVGVIAALWIIRRWTRAQKSPPPAAASDPAPELLRQQLLRDDLEVPDLEDRSPRASLLRERARLRSELIELDFDFQSGKLSESDFNGLRNEIAAKGAAVLRDLEALPVKRPAAGGAAAKASMETSKKTARPQRGVRRWQLVSGAIFLLLFGITLGVFLTQSVRQRGSEMDSITGDFMTGTAGGGGSELRATLAEAKSAFAKQDFKTAIAGFNKVLAADPSHPEAHAYMGFILVQAGHGDEALSAFDRALARAPNFPMALWGKGMALYQEKKDYAAARAIFERLLTMMPPGNERDEVTKVLAEIPNTPGAPPPTAAQTANAASSPQSAARVSGKITVDAKLKDKIDPNASLFIIARAAGAAAGPPLAVKKIDKPKFPLDYSLGQENVMMQGTPFSGKVTLTVRLDKDGNPITRGPGDLTGEYKKNPADVGAKNVDIVLDQLTQ